jgi:hypothetical protein
MRPGDRSDFVIARRAARTILTSSSLGRNWLDSRRLRQRQRDWSVVHQETFATTTLSVLTTIGLGDVVIAEQLCEEFARYCKDYGDPRLGRIVITAGALPPEFKPPKGDHRLYWWWSMNGQDDWLDRYVSQTKEKPQVVACLSSWCCRYAQALGLRTLYLPLAAGESFQPLGFERAGIGYAGSKGHKDVEQVAALLDPFAGDGTLEWVTGLKGATQINEFYNRKSIVLGLTERYQEKAGMVNNRVFEVLASGTPFIVHRHRALEEIMEQPYPYQSGSADQSRSLAREIMADYPRHLEIFDGYRRIVDAKHRYKHRLKTMIDYLRGRQ